MKKLKCIYGPVYSWRLGVSLGIDPLSSEEKICNFDCTYCQLGKTRHLTNDRKVYVPAREIIRELHEFSYQDKIQYLTFSGRGEPTLARNLGEMIQAVRSNFSQKIAVITNSSLLHLPEVQRDVARADFVMAKVDVSSQQGFHALNQGMQGMDYKTILNGIIRFREQFAGKLALQIMFVEENEPDAREIALISRQISPDEVQLNTPLRACAVKPLGRIKMEKIKEFFYGLPVLSVYDVEPQSCISVDDQETVLRHGNAKIKEVGHVSSGTVSKNY